MPRNELQCYWPLLACTIYLRNIQPYNGRSSFEDNFCESRICVVNHKLLTHMIAQEALKYDYRLIQPV